MDNPIKAVTDAAKSSLNLNTVLKFFFGTLVLFAFLDVIEMFTGFSVSSLLFNPITYLKNKFGG